MRRTATKSILSFEDIKERIDIEQVLAYFDMPTEEALVVCPFHDDDNPSLQINKKSVYCHGCNKHWDSFAFVKQRLSLSVKETFIWFSKNIDALPEKSSRHYVATKYHGPVDLALVAQWAYNLTEDHYATLFEERLLHKDTVDKYGIGWRIDWKAYSIPFWRGIPQESEIDIVQFRLTDPDAKCKYIGLKGHNRTSVMNAHLLTEPQVYVLVLFGSFDPILAAQDGLITVGINGSNIAKKDQTRIKDMFKRQSNIFIVPDHTDSEIKPAYQLAELIGGQVRFYPEDTKKDTDYIAYRRTGKTAQDFMREVLWIDYRPAVAEDLISLVNAGDPYSFLDVHLSLQNGAVAADLAFAVASKAYMLKLPLKRKIEFAETVKNIKSEDVLKDQLSAWAKNMYAYQGGW